MAEKLELNVCKLEKLLYYIAESQAFGAEKDQLSELLISHAVYMEEEMSAEELEYVVAAAKTAVSRYIQDKRKG